MFKKIRYRLLFSYIVVLASILVIFAIAVRIYFQSSLARATREELIALGEGAAASAKFENNQVLFENEFPIKEITANHRALQWFDTQGNLIYQQGIDTINLRVSFTNKEQIQAGKNPVQSVTLPILGNEDGKLIGYVRVSKSLKEINELLSILDLGLGGGIILSLLLSSLGGVYLTAQAMQPIEESFQRLKQFTADASHELRSPLMAIKSNARVALKYPDGMREGDTEKFQDIISATNQMTCLTEDLLFLARNDKNPHHKKESVNLTKILENLVQLYKSQAEAKEIKLICELSENIELLGDSGELKRLFTNLIENALHYTLSSGEIKIKTSHVNSYILVEIQDTGVGIAPENLNKVFERFWRGDNSRSYHSGSSGLGLSIASAIAQSHGGLITVSSQLGVGSCFSVSLLAKVVT
jgi:two-component system, OmpR family, manganese sensing sensor histidine kinase